MFNHYISEILAILFAITVGGFAVMFALIQGVLKNA